MAFYGPLNALRFDADVALGGRRATMLEQSLNKDDVVPIIFVNLCREPFPEAMGADTLVAQIIAYDAELLLNRPFCYRKDGVLASDAVS